MQQRSSHAPLPSAPRHTYYCTGLARKKTAGAVLAQINSLEGDGARGADDAFAGSGVEKPDNIQGLLNEEKDQLLDGVLGGDEWAEQEEEGEQDEEAEEEMSLEEAMEDYKEQYHDCMTQVKAFISFCQVRRTGQTGTILRY